MTDEYVSAKLAEARAALGSGNRASAYFALKRALKRDADNPEAKLLAARLNLADGDIAGASNITRDLLAASAGEEGGAEAESLAELCLGCELWFDAARLYSALSQEQPDNEGFCRRAGQASYRCGRFSDAREFFGRCIELHPERAYNFLQLGHAARALGDSQLAEEQYRKYVASSEEGKAAGYWSLADLPGHEFSGADVDAMNELAVRLPEEGPEASMLQFAMGVAAEQGKRYKRAFGHFRQANATQSQFRQFSAAEFERTLKSLAGARSNLAPSVSAGEITPVFVVGLPGSGIALVERVLAAHPAVATTGGLTYLDRIALDLERSGGYVPRLAGLTDSDARMYRQRYLDDAGRHLPDGATVLVEQSPINFMHLGLVCRLLPEAVVIDVRCDLRDVAMFNYRRSFISGINFPSTLEDMTAYAKGYLDLMGHWRSVSPGMIREQSCEALLDDPEAEIAALLGFCSLASDRACFDALSTPGQAGPDAGQWKNYRKWLGPEFDKLATLQAEH